MSKSQTEITRVTRSKETAKASYDKMSRWYDLFGRFERKYREAGLRKLPVEEGAIILEIGFGTGHSLLALAQSAGPSGKVYGIDISEGMYKTTLSRIKETGLSERVQLTCADAVKLPYKANFFGAIFMSFTLELFDTPEIPIVLSECQRVLRTGGHICVVAMAKKEKSGTIVKIYEWFHKKFPNFIDCRPIFVQQAMKDANFEIIDVTEMSMWGLPVEIVLAKKSIVRKVRINYFP